jgi:ACS family tartrate transporter-like MFS transporter
MTLKTSLAPPAAEARGRADVTAPAWTIWNKIRVRQQLPLMVIVILSSLDRVNISFAALHMNASLGMTSEALGVAVGVFFVGNLLFQFPSTAIQRRIGTRCWMAGTICMWGICAMGMSVVHHATTLYVLRFLLGVAESGLTPGIVFYCST